MPRKKSTKITGWIYGVHGCRRIKKGGKKSGRQVIEVWYQVCAQSSLAFVLLPLRATFVSLAFDFFCHCVLRTDLLVSHAYESQSMERNQSPATAAYEKKTQEEVSRMQLLFVMFWRRSVPCCVACCVA